MKKLIIIFLLTIIMLITTGCDNSRGAYGRSGTGQSAVTEEVLKKDMTEADSGNSDTGRLPPDTVMADEGPYTIDIDLTGFSSTMIYAEVYNMMVSPEDYIGKTIKMNGLFSYYHDEDTDNEYFFCIDI